MIKIDGNKVSCNATGKELLEGVTLAVALLYKTMKDCDISKEDFVDCFYEMVDGAMKAVDEVYEGKDMFQKFVEFLKKEREENE